LAADKIVARRALAANARDHVDGSVVGGRFENIGSPSHE
jgi:hypothetical protein